MNGSVDKLLRVENLTKKFGGLTALNDYNLTLESREIVGLIGPNGAGKTTVFNLLSGVIHPDSGRIYFRGNDITYSKPDKNAFLGIARTFQNIRLFQELTVVDNVKVAFHMHHGSSLLQTIVISRSFRKVETEMDQRASHILDMLGLSQYRDELAKNLSYGDQRRVELARCLAADPEIVLLDEPTAGLNPHETGSMMEILSRIHDDFGLTILLVEHDMKVIMGICRRIQVIDQGRTIAMGTPEEIRRNPLVIEAYLGRPKKRLESNA